MKKEDMQTVLAALKINRVMGADENGNYTREITPKQITNAIAIMQAALDAPSVEPIQYAEIAIGVLGDRKGFDNWWDELDEDLQQEIMQEIDRAINAAAPKGDKK